MPPDPIAGALFGVTRLRVLALLFGRPHESFYLRQVARETGSGVGATQREVARLVVADIVRRTQRGNQVHFQANADSPVFNELRDLLAKTAGLASVLRATLGTLIPSGSGAIAFIYGSAAAGKQTASSDIDLMLIGDVSQARLLPVLRKAQARLGREVNATVYPLDEFTSKLDRGEHFARRSMASPRIMLIGDDRELEKLAGKRLARRA
jgi:predicted nucleotidyltransferase